VRIGLRLPGSVSMGHSRGKFAFSFADAGWECHIVSRNRTGAPRRENSAQRRVRSERASRLDLGGQDAQKFPRVFLALLAPRDYLDGPRATNRRHLGTGPAPGPHGLAGRRLLNKPVVMDMAENYPAMIQDTWDYRGHAPGDVIVRNPAFLRALERWVLPGWTA